MYHILQYHVSINIIGRSGALPRSSALKVLFKVI